MRLPDVIKQLTDETANVKAGSLDARDDLGMHHQYTDAYIWVPSTNLGYYFQPRIHRNSSEAISNHTTHIVMGSKFEPKREKSKGVLQRIIPA